MNVFLVLMWKHAVVRLQRFIHTFMELVCPLLFFILLFAVKPLLLAIVEGIISEKKGDMPELQKMPIANIVPRPYWLMYSPESTFTNSLMDEVGAKLSLKRISSNSDFKQHGYSPLPKGYRFADIVPQMRTNQAILIFNEADPERLNYSIRMKGDFSTHTTTTLNEKKRAQTTYGFQYGTFLVIQWAVDTSFIHLKSNKDITQDLSFQSLPEIVMKSIGNLFFIILVRYVCLISLMLTFIFHMSRLLQERTSGIQELMKMVGVSGPTQGFCHYLNVLPVGVIYAAGGTIACKASSQPLVPQTSGFIIFVMLFLYFNSVIAMAFVCSYISRGTHYGVILSALTYFLSNVPYYYLSGRVKKYKWKLLIGLLPHGPLSIFWSEVTIRMAMDKGVNFSNFKEKAHDDPSVLYAFLLMVLQTLICYALTWYLSLVRPGQYGQALPWNFLCKRRTSQEILDENELDLLPHDKRYFEPGLQHAEAGIKVVNVSKVYPKHKALNNVSLEVYKGEITVLLGHNGAGKTTLMSIITGMTSATEGSVFVNGMDTVTQKSEVRQNIGLCPQHNLFFDDLTVRQHIMFYSMLKRGSYSEANQTASRLTELLGISNKLNSYPSELSGGMKRRAQLACALAGGADVLVLDEPTSGLDVETRRGLWDLLLSLRGERTVLLTTHFMEEADALGDRVAALSGGRLKCFATPMYLKKALGTGYRLSLITIGMPKVEPITEVVTSHVSDATVKEQTNNSLSYNLPAAHSSNFPKLFSALEAKKSKLGIQSIGVGVSTLEEVFLKLCSDIDTSYNDDELEVGRQPELPPMKLKGISLYVRQFYVLLKRQVKYAIHKKWVFLFLQLIIPITVICLLTQAIGIVDENKTKKPKQNALIMNVDQFNHIHLVFLHLEGPHFTTDDIIKVANNWPNKVKFPVTEEIVKFAVQFSKSMVEYMIILGGIEANKFGFTVICNPLQRHGAPIILNILSNTLAAHNIPSSDGKSIITYNDPLAREIIEVKQKETKELTAILFLGFLLCFIFMAVNILNISLPCQERLTGARQIHVMSGCPVELHWLATLSFHMMMSTLAIIIPTVLAMKFLDKDKTFTDPSCLGTLTLILFLGCMAFLAFSYLVSLILAERAASIFLIACVIIFVVTSAPTKVTMENAGPIEEMGSKDAIQYYAILSVSYIVTPHLIAETVMKCLNVARVNHWCKLVEEDCPALRIDDMAFDIEKCCAGEKPRCYFCMDIFAPAEGMILLLVHFLIYMTLVILTERRVFNGVEDKLMNMWYKPRRPAEQDDLVRAEKDYVSRTITLSPDRIPDAMLVNDLHKNYASLCKKDVNAIKGVSFSVKKGECFGLLGVNGAGKSTCFKMMTAEECPTRGKIFSNGFFLRRGNSQYLQTLGYCPQFFGLDMFQTGEENLAMVLTLRGYDSQQVKEEVRNWIEVVGLEKYAQQRVEGYSGGCVRRLGTASALCGGAQMALLDEPTSGVDPAARRRLWTALRKGLRSQRAVIITSHSMDEMEALCSRIAILANGQVRALGTAAALRAAHAQGHAVTFKIKHASGGKVDEAKTQLNKLKVQLQGMFNCTLKDEHKTTLHYHINETLPYSTLFAELEALRQDYPDLIEDYSVTETTLEEVFLSFAKEQRTNRRQAV